MQVMHGSMMEQRKVPTVLQATGSRRRSTIRRQSFSGQDLESCSDQDLISKYFAGDPRAFRVLAQRHRQRLLRIAWRYAGSETDAEDMLQEVMLKVALHLHKYRGESALSTWMHRLAVNSCFDVLNKNKRTAAIPVDLDVAHPSLHKQLSHDPVDAVASSLTVTKALGVLSPEQRCAIVLVDYLGFGMRDVADILGIQPGTVKSRRARARQQLREFLQEDA